MDTISIIIPAYNCSDFLDNCLASLTQQTYTKWEAIVVNDGSNDKKTPNLCDAWGKKDPRIRVFHLSHNQGVSVARNEGLMHATSPLLTFLDSDDSMAPTHLESLARALKKSDASIAMCGLTKCFESGQRFRKRSLLPRNTLLEQPDIFSLAAMEALKIITSHLWNKLYRRELFEGIAFPVGHNFEDYAVMLDVMARVERMIHTGEATYYYRRNSSSITHTPSIKNRRDYFLAASCRIEQIKAYPLLSEEDRNRLIVWPIKRMVKLYHSIRKDPESPEKEEAIKLLTSRLLELNIPPAIGTYRLQNINYSLQKRLFEREFFRHFRQKL